MKGVRSETSQEFFKLRREVQKLVEGDDQLKFTDEFTGDTEKRQVESDLQLHLPPGENVA